jgi:hypothetical protein
MHFKPAKMIHFQTGIESWQATSFPFKIRNLVALKADPLTLHQWYYTRKALFRAV